MQHEAVPLLCLPFAGAGATFYRPWEELGLSGVDVRALQLPGREGRAAEPPHVDLHAAADELVAEAARASRGGPVTLFGHSLGAVLAYELAHRLVRRGVRVVHLFVSGSPGPWTARTQRATGLGDEEFLAAVQGLAGYRHPAYDVPEMRDLLMPTLRADVQMHEDYRPRGDHPLTAPITSLRGRDDHLVPEAEVRQWRAATSVDFTHAEFPGGHMYLTESARPILELVAETLSSTASSHR
jgi:surfactin synthase thioesterase subunit